MLVDAGGDATLMVHEGYRLEEEMARLGKKPSANSKSEEMRIVQKLLISGLEKDPQKWHRMVKKLRGVSEETTTGVNRLYQMQASGKLLFPAVNVNDSVTNPSSTISMAAANHWQTASNAELTSWWLARS